MHYSAENNWGYPTEQSHAAPALKLKKNCKSASLAARFLFCLKISSLSALSIVAVFVFLAQFEIVDIAKLAQRREAHAQSDDSHLQAFPLAVNSQALVPNKKKSVWRCGENFTNDPNSAEQCASIELSKRVDAKGNHFISGDWDKSVQSPAASALEAYIIN